MRHGGQNTHFPARLGLAFPLWIELNHITVFNLGMGEITVILLLALIVLGPKKLPELASGLGKIIRDLRKATADVKNEIQLDDAIRKPFEELRDAVTLPPEELKRRDRIKRDIEEAKRKAEAEAGGPRRGAAGRGEPPGDEANSRRRGRGRAGAAGEQPIGRDSAYRRRWPHPAFRCRRRSLRPARAPTATRFRRRFIRRTLPALRRTRRPSPHAAGAGPIAAAPPGTVPATPRPRPAFRPAVAAAPPVPPPKPAPERSSTTQFLSEADLIPPDRPAPPPVPPPIPGSTGKHTAVVSSVSGTTGKGAAAAAPAHEVQHTAHEEAPSATVANGASSHETKHETKKDEDG